MTLVMRRNQITLSVDEKVQFVTAVRALKNTGTMNKYDQYVKTHLDFSQFGHGGPAFLPWHREFLRRFEQDLQQVTQDPLLALPYWDWSVDNSKTSTIWLSGFMGGDDGQVRNGPFAYNTGLWTLNIRTSEEPTNYLKREFGSNPDARSLPTASDVVNTLGATPYDVPPWNDTSRSGFRNTLEGWIPGRVPQMHNRVHVWVGGSMGPMTSPNDPVFWLHHCFIDRLWADWQEAHPDASYLPINGAAPGHNLNDPMPPWNQASDTVRPASVLNHRALGYRYDVADYLLPGEELQPGQYINSASGNYFVEYENDGRVILRNRGFSNPFWDSGTRFPNSTGSRCVMQPDGNLVSYDPNGRAIWASDTEGTANKNSYLVVRAEGLLAIYRPGESRPIWSQP